jgi:simple sugar transport system ATP-binding protein
MRVEIKDIRKYFGTVKANDGVSFMLEAGKVYGLLGENGAGKSTLMKILSGFQPADSGEILFDGSAKSFEFPADALRAGIGMLYQEPLDLPPFKVLENYQLGRGEGVVLNQKEAAAELTALGKRYEFEIDLDEYVGDLSVGERQQLELIRLLAGGAQVLILDEPTTGISAEQKELLFDSMRKLAHDEGKTLILVSHKLSEVQELCDYAFVLRSGKIVGEKSIPCPTEELVELMFGEVPERSERPKFSLGEPALEIQDVSISTYRLDVESVNLEIRKGEIFGLAGLEGSGQDLLLKACIGLMQPSAGRIRLDGEDITRKNYHQLQQAGIAYIAAGRLEEGLVAGLSLTEHMVMAAPKKEFFIDWDGSRQRTRQRIDRYQVVGRPSSNIDQLSGGNQQRFLFAMLNRPLKLILMEQPTRGLDIVSVNGIWERLYKRREDGTAIIFISADLDEIIDRSDRVAAFSGGVMSRVVDADKTSVDELGHLIGGHI